MPFFLSRAKRKIGKCMRRLTGGQNVLADCGSMLQSFVGTFCPCFRGLGSAKYQSLSEDEATTDKGQVAADKVGSVMMFVAVVSYAMLLFKFSFAIKVELMDEYTRNLPLILYATILEVLVCGASARTAALMYRRRRHVRKHPNDLRKSEYVKVGPITRGELTRAWGFSYRPSVDGIEALLVEEIYQSSPVAQWNSTVVAKTATGTPASLELASAELGVKDSGNGSPLANEMNEMGEATPEKPRDSELVDINLAVNSAITEMDETADEMPPIEESKLYYGLAIVGVNEIHGDVGPMQVELLTAKTVTLYCHQHLGDPTLDDAEIEAAKPSAHVIGNRDAMFATELPECHHVVSVVGLEDEEPQMLLRWILCAFTFGWVTLLPSILIDPHEERPRQTQFRLIFGTAAKIVLPIWILMWIVDTVSLILHVEFLSPFTYYVTAHMVLAGVVVILGMKLQSQDTDHVLEQRRIRRAEVESRIDEENGAILRPFVVEDPPPTLLRELLICNPIATVFMGALVAIPLVLGQILYPLKTDRGKLAQTYVFLSFGSLCLLQLITAVYLWNLQFEYLPTMYLTGFGALIWYPCFFAYCVCLVCSGHYAKRDMDLCRQQRIDRAAQYGKQNDGVELGETRGREWELCFSA